MYPIDWGMTFLLGSVVTCGILLCGNGITLLKDFRERYIKHCAEQQEINRKDKEIKLEKFRKQTGLMVGSRVLRKKEFTSYVGSTRKIVGSVINFTLDEHPNWSGDRVVIEWDDIGEESIRKDYLQEYITVDT